MEKMAAATRAAKHDGGDAAACVSDHTDSVGFFVVLPVVSTTAEGVVEEEDQRRAHGEQRAPGVSVTNGMKGWSSRRHVSMT